MKGWIASKDVRSFQDGSDNGVKNVAPWEILHQRYQSQIEVDDIYFWVASIPSWSSVKTLPSSNHQRAFKGQWVYNPLFQTLLSGWAIPSDSGSTKLRNSSCFGADLDTMAFDKATESTLDSPTACALESDGWQRFLFGEFHLMLAWCRVSKMFWIESRQDKWNFIWTWMSNMSRLSYLGLIANRIYPCHWHPCWLQSSALPSSAPHFGHLRQPHWAVVSWMLQPARCILWSTDRKIIWFHLSAWICLSRHWTHVNICHAKKTFGKISADV